MAHSYPAKIGIFSWLVCTKATQITNIELLVGGWATPLKNMKVSWDDDIPHIWKNKFHVPNYQPDKH